MSQDQNALGVSKENLDKAMSMLAESVVMPHVEMRRYTHDVAPTMPGFALAAGLPTNTTFHQNGSFTIK